MAANNLQINVNVGGNALTQLQAVQSRIKKTDAAVKQSARGYTVFGAAADKSTDKTRRFAQAGIQQAGFQLGDFAVQLQNGTSFLTALVNRVHSCLVCLVLLVRCLVLLSPLVLRLVRSY